MFIGFTITILRESEGDGSLDVHGDPIPGETLEIESTGWAIGWPQTTESFEAWGESPLSSASFYRREDADILPSDRIRWDNKVWAVQGELQTWQNPYDLKQRGVYFIASRVA